MGAVALLVMALVAVVAVVGVIGLVIAAVALVVKALPVLLSGYVAVKVIQRVERPRMAMVRSSDAWLDRRD